MMMKSLVEGEIYWLNAFLSNNGVSNTIGPTGIVIGRPQPYSNIKMIAFGAYSTAYTKTKNDMKLRGLPEIGLKPSNDQGGKYFISLLTGKHINAYHWEEFPKNDEVIMEVEDLAEKENQLTLFLSGLRVPTV